MQYRCRRGGFDSHNLSDELRRSDESVRVDYHWHPKVLSEVGHERAVGCSHNFREVRNGFLENGICCHPCGLPQGGSYMSELGVIGGLSAASGMKCEGGRTVSGRTLTFGDDNH